MSINQIPLGQLFLLLDEATDLLAEFSGGFSNGFSSAEEFLDALVISTNRLKNGDSTEIKQLNLWFLPGCEWDDFTGKDGQILGNAISQLLSLLQKPLSRLN